MIDLINMNSEIDKIIDNNKVNDLKRFLGRRKCLNESNIYLIYLFHLIQSTGLILTSYATGTNNINLVWVGISLNMVATLINIYEKTNNTILKKLISEIKSIKDGSYIDEGVLVDSSTEPNVKITDLDLNTQVKPSTENAKSIV